MRCLKQMCTFLPSQLGGGGGGPDPTTQTGGNNFILRTSISKDSQNFWHKYWVKKFVGFGLVHKVSLMKAEGNQG